ncbi:MAG TPA: protein kinase [Aggregatilineales bacterium]|nr:protein kinase [Anaerolineales bacterium]HRE46771.1 protein kinase [Aggregatilineales bacterium]
MDRPNDPLLGRTISKYVIDGVLGGGGMGTVYRARQVNTSREVALKVINADLADSDQFITRFQREAEAIAALEHAHIIPVYDYGQEGGILYLVMALKTGGNLGDLIKSGERLEMREIARIAGQIASALDLAHSRGVIHRDLKPANILLDEQRNCFLTDFGIARRLGETKLTAQGMVVGSPIYMAPEAWRGEDPSAETDIYSLAVILFEMVTGQPVYVEKAPARLMMRHINDPIPSIRAARPDLPDGVEVVFNRALAKNRNDRFRTATEFVQNLRMVLGLPVRGSTTARGMSNIPLPPEQAPRAAVADDSVARARQTPSRPMDVPHAPSQPQPQQSAMPQQMPQPQASNSARAGMPQPRPAQPASTGGIMGAMNNRIVLIGMGGLIVILLIVIILLINSR